MASSNECSDLRDLDLRRESVSGRAKSQADYVKVQDVLAQLGCGTEPQPGRVSERARFLRGRAGNTPVRRIFSLRVSSVWLNKTQNKRAVARPGYLWVLLWTRLGESNGRPEAREEVEGFI
jgi:hypothetical protein